MTEINKRNFFAGVLIHTFAAGSGERETVRMWGAVSPEKKRNYLTKLFINRKICLL
ncbi:hypothetical protein HMPREF1981_03010 [Bacteroides pyogenes F0041]|uniref:Uncharacterized protein n=1 Tax=Bacteroides pyogenes F0041 TaxID=1321819 RepID=U2DPI0_9BACE|nr:hypothetical protein HMPREF1981_03010 [Bacteroides pyogenes F0041]GAE20854.1 hypothetical protein JCM10003_236 [Bacteroides pyogenes JCM 10003]